MIRSSSALCASVLAVCYAAAPPAPAPSDPGWPRQFTDGAAKLVIYQPQVDSWDDFKKLEARFAIALTPAKGAPTVYGALLLNADSIVDMSARSVQLGNFTVANVRFASSKSDAEGQSWKALVTKLLPAGPVTVSLDRILAYMDKGKLKTREDAVSLAPPPIMVSKQAAILVMIDGKPILNDVENTSLQHVVNTNWDLFLDKSDSRYYLRDDKSWLSAKSLDDVWSPVTKLPADFAKLPASEQFTVIKQTAAAPQGLYPIPLVLLAYKPTELILLKGDPEFKPIPGTQLMWVVNTESDLFFDLTARSFYFLVSGRWFTSGDLQSGKWTPATTTLPADFQRIPPDYPCAHVLASIPGTKEAEEAMLNATIPTSATLDRQTAKAKVEYVGDPKFEPIAGTTVSYAANTPNDVLLVNGVYYLCLDGAWFSATTPNGPWQLADKIPQEIYSIPSTSEKYNVTYVNVYDSTPTYVTYGYTAGYVGVYTAYGVAVWGTGYYYPPYYAYGVYAYPVYWPRAYYTYGASAWYNPATGAYARGSAVYGPYGGYGRAAAYNPSTGGYAWGRAAYGPYGAAAAGGHYNPNTGVWGGSYHATNGYQSWGQSVHAKGDQWARTASYSDSRGTVAGARTSQGGGAIAASGSQGQGFVARSGSTGDVYAGKDGNVYKKSGDQWYKSNNGSWDSVNRPTGSATQQANASQARSEAQSRANAAGVNRDSAQSLNSEAAARSRGNYNADRSNSARSSGSYGGSGGGGWQSRGGGGGGGFSRGGGGRRR